MEKYSLKIRPDLNDIIKGTLFETITSYFMTATENKTFSLKEFEEICSKESIMKYMQENKISIDMYGKLNPGEEVVKNEIKEDAGQVNNKLQVIVGKFELPGTIFVGTLQEIL